MCQTFSPTAITIIAICCIIDNLSRALSPFIIDNCMPCVSFLTENIQQMYNIKKGPETSMQLWKNRLTCLTLYIIVMYSCHQSCLPFIFGIVGSGSVPLKYGQKEVMLSYAFQNCICA